MTLSEEVSAAIALAEAALEGPWCVHGEYEVFQKGPAYKTSKVADCHSHGSTTALIAASHQHVDLIRRLWAEVERLREEVGRYYADLAARKEPHE